MRGGLPQYGYFCAGGVLGSLTGIAALAIPSLGPLIAAGPIVAALAGVGAAGAVEGIIGALAGWGIPEHEARRFEGRIKQGGVLQTGGEDIGSAGESGADFSVGDKPMLRTRRAGIGDPLSGPGEAFQSGDNEAIKRPM